MLLDERKVIARRRCALELRAGPIVNLGIGMPEGVGAIVAEELSDLFTLTFEPGVIGGVPASGISAPWSKRTRSFTKASNFDFYDGCCLVTCCAQA
jgi:propionate CoA-transferase